MKLRITCLDTGYLIEYDKVVPNGTRGSSHSIEHLTKTVCVQSVAKFNELENVIAKIYKDNFSQILTDKINGVE